MLTGDLLRVRFRKDEIHLPYIDELDRDHLGVAETLIRIFERHEGGTRQELDEELTDTTGAGTGFLFHRGLSKLLKDRCTFASASPVDPVELRRRIFEGAAAAYRDTEQVRIDREAILTEAAKSAAIGAEAVEGAFYADLRAAERLESFKPCKAEWLLSRYNVALAQAVLLRASELDLYIEGESPARYRDLFRKMKFFRLLHEIRQTGPGEYHIRIDGPMSLFKSSQRYGLQIAQFLPAVLHCAHWRVAASVVWGARRRKGVFRLTPETGLKPIGPTAGQWVPEEVVWLEERFARLNSVWRIAAGTDVVDLGGQGVLVPEYVFTHPPTGTRVYLDFLGYWRSGGVRTRLDLLSRYGPPNMILAISAELGVDEEASTDIPGEVYRYRRTPVARDILGILDAMVDSASGRSQENLSLFDA
ncbi:MAG: DUF790 family protein [Gemmatimonadetes bacterium]|nr:DUF790 family protein [Gemmatimonadota bacterium]